MKNLIATALVLLALVGGEVAQITRRPIWTTTTTEQQRRTA